LSGGWHKWEGEDIRNRCGRMNMEKYYVLMYENGKMRPVETILRMDEGESRRMMDQVNLTQIYCKHFCKCQNIPPV
jgi:hypothetical protein